MLAARTRSEAGHMCLYGPERPVNVWGHLGSSCSSSSNMSLNRRRRRRSRLRPSLRERYLLSFLESFRTEGIWGYSAIWFLWPSHFLSRMSAPWLGAFVEHGWLRRDTDWRQGISATDRSGMTLRFGEDRLRVQEIKQPNCEIDSLTIMLRDLRKTILVKPDFMNDDNDVLMMVLIPMIGI